MENSFTTNNFTTNARSYVNNLLGAVRLLRERRVKLSAELERNIAIINETERGKMIQDLKLEIAALNFELADLEVRARDAAVLAYKETGDKHPVPGTEVKSYTTVTITDERAAIKWAAENAPALVKLDTTKFNAAVKLLDLPFICITEEPRGTIASDLSNID